MRISIKKLQDQGCECEIRLDKNQEPQYITFHPEHRWNKEAEGYFDGLCTELNFRDKDRDTLRGDIYKLQMFKIIARASDL